MIASARRPRARRLAAAITCALACLGLLSGLGAPASARGTRAASAAGVADLDPSDWLGEINRYRSAAGLSGVTDQPAWDAGLQNHITYLEKTPSQYLVAPYVSIHTENPASPYYTQSGALEAGYSDLESGLATTPVGAIDVWLAAPFHAIGMLRAQLAQVGLGLDPNTGFAALDVIQGLDYSLPAATAPILFPGPGITTGLTSYAEGEVPDPLETCGWQNLGTQVGLPLIALLPQAPAQGLSASLVAPDGTSESTAAGDLCLVDEYTYTSSDAVYGPTGKSILVGDRAVILIPRERLSDGSYSVDISQPSQPDISWSFSVATTPLPTVPVNTSPPLITGTAVQGGVLRVVDGGWTNDPTSFIEQWERCDAAGANCTAIADASGATYTLGSADLGATIRVAETAADAAGAGTSASSSATAVVHAAAGSDQSSRPPATAAPNTRLLTVAVSSRHHSVRFRFSAIGAASAFQCALVRRPARVGASAPTPRYSACRSPKVFNGLRAGRYLFHVRAVGSGGTDRSPASYRFSIA
jgi:hypothetical protein